MTISELPAWLANGGTLASGIVLGCIPAFVARKRDAGNQALTDGATCTALRSGLGLSL